MMHDEPMTQKRRKTKEKEKKKKKNRRRKKDAILNDVGFSLRQGFVVIFMSAC
jgi:hypothetical protein